MSYIVRNLPKLFFLPLIILILLVSPLLLKNQAQASSGGTLFGLEQTTYPNSVQGFNTADLQLVNVDQSTGQTTPVGQSLASIFPGIYYSNSSMTTLDAVNHRVFYWASYSNLDGTQSSTYPNGFIVIQDTQSGAILAKLPVDSNFQQNYAFESSTGRLLGLEQTTYPNPDQGINSADLQLVSVDQVTGATTPIGNSLANVFPGIYYTNSSMTTIDEVGHRIFYWVAYANLDGTQSDTYPNGFLVVQDTQTGAILAKLPVDDNLEQNYVYDASTGNLLGLERSLYPNSVQGFDTADLQLVSINQTTGVITVIGQSLANSFPGIYYANSSMTTIDSDGSRIFYWTAYSNLDGTQSSTYPNGFVVIQDLQTGNILAKLPVDSNFQQNYVFEPSSSTNQLTALSPAKVWMSHGTLDAGIKLDLLAQAYANGALVSSGEVDSVSVGSNVGPNGITQQTIPFTSFSPVDFPSGTTLSIQISARNACSGSGRNSGTANLWYNTSIRDSNFDATIGGNDANYYLLSDSVLGTSAGSGPLKSTSVQAGAKCSAFKSLGTWTVTP